MSEIPTIIQENPGLWDPKLTLRQNAANHKIKYGWARKIAIKYKLKYSLEKKPRVKPNNWNIFLTIKENADILNISRQAARHLVKKFDLDYRKNFKFILQRYAPDFPVTPNSKYSPDLQKFLWDEASVLL